jgi:hypothetical protein
MPSCSVCRHPLLTEINHAITTGELSFRELQARYGVGRASLSRHKPHIPAELTEAATESAVEPLTGTLVEQTRKVIEETRALVKKAEQSGHYQVAMNGLKAIGSNLELLAKLTGELQSGTQIAVGVNVNVERERWGASDLNVLRWALARHVAGMVTFAPEAIEELRQLAAAPCPQCNRLGCSHDTI